MLNMLAAQIRKQILPDLQYRMPISLKKSLPKGDNSEPKINFYFKLTQEAVFHKSSKIKRTHKKSHKN